MRELYKHIWTSIYFEKMDTDDKNAYMKKLIFFGNNEILSDLIQTELVLFNIYAFEEDFTKITEAEMLAEVKSKNGEKLQP